MKTKCIIVDIDGTISCCNHRRHFVSGKNKNWDAFFAEQDKDPLVEPVADIVKAISHFSEHIKNIKEFDSAFAEIHDLPTGTQLTEYDPAAIKEIIFCTGRSEEFREVTLNWLRKHKIPFTTLMMRPSGDFRSDVLVKEEMLEKIQQDYEVQFCLDDRNSIVEMWRSKGLVCLQVAPGDFDTKIERCRKPNLYIMVGPSGSGKTTFLDNIYELGNTSPLYNVHKDSIISSDKLREDLTDDFRDQSKNDEVFKAMHDIAEARLKNGLNVVLDATHIRAKDRKEAVELGIKTDANIFYVVVNRPLKEKLETAGWRSQVQVKGKSLVEYHDDVFQSNLKDIMNCDGYENINLVIV